LLKRKTYIILTGIDFLIFFSYHCFRIQHKRFLNNGSSRTVLPPVNSLRRGLFLFHINLFLYLFRNWSV